MASVNKVILVGNLGADPEVRYLPSGDAVANIRLATTDRYKDKQSGDFKEATEWHRVAFFGKLAEIVGQYLKKGSSVYIEGRIRTRKWQDQAGQDKYSLLTRCRCLAVVRKAPMRGATRVASPRAPAEVDTMVDVARMVVIRLAINVVSRLRRTALKTWTTISRSEVL